MHNHPSGDPKASRDDIEMTREIRKAAEALGISIHDHLVNRPQGARELPEPGVALVVEPQQVVLGQADSVLIVAPQAPWNDVTVKLVCCVAGTSPEAEREPRSCQATPQVQQGRRVARTPLRH